MKTALPVQTQSQLWRLKKYYITNYYITNVLNIWRLVNFQILIPQDYGILEKQVIIIIIKTMG